VKTLTTILLIGFAIGALYFAKKNNTLMNMSRTVYSPSGQITVFN